MVATRYKILKDGQILIVEMEEGKVSMRIGISGVKYPAFSSKGILDVCEGDEVLYILHKTDVPNHDNLVRENYKIIGDVITFLGLEVCN